MKSNMVGFVLAVLLTIAGLFSSPYAAGSQVVAGAKTQVSYCITPPEQQMLDQINNLRKQQNLDPLVPSVLLGSMAEGHSIDMRDFTWTNGVGKNQTGYFDHTSPSGETLKNRADDVGFPSSALLGENILWGTADAQKAFSSWQTSQPHYTNMVDSRFKSIGVGFAAGSGPDGGAPSDLWTAVFGSITLNGDTAKPCENPAPTTIPVTPSPTVSTLPTVTPTTPTTPVVTPIPTETNPVTLTPTATMTETPTTPSVTPSNGVRNVICTGVVKADGSITVNCVNAPQ